MKQKILVIEEGIIGVQGATPTLSKLLKQK